MLCTLFPPLSLQPHPLFLFPFSQYAMEDRKALGEVLKNYVRVSREDRQKVEQERVEKMRRKLGLLTVEEPATKEVRVSLIH